MLDAAFSMIQTAFDFCIYYILFPLQDHFNLLGVSLSVFIIYATYRFLIRPLVGGSGIGSGSDYVSSKFKGRNHDPKNTSGTHSGD